MKQTIQIRPEQAQSIIKAFEAAAYAKQIANARLHTLVVGLQGKVVDLTLDGTLTLEIPEP